MTHARLASGLNLIAYLLSENHDFGFACASFIKTLHSRWKMKGGSKEEIKKKKILKREKREPGRKRYTLSFIFTREADKSVLCAQF